jgi:hypothetical protein
MFRYYAIFALLILLAIKHNPIESTVYTYLKYDPDFGPAKLNMI